MAGVAAGAPLILRSGLRAASPNGKLQHACIGVTRMGGNDLKNFLGNDRVEIVALCDVDSAHLEEAAKQVPNARRYTDWREMFATEGDKIDSVNVTTPDHMHFPIAHEALRLGKHVYCQKPMCHDIAEVRLLTEFATQKGVVTQLGTQHASKIGDRMMVRYMQDGVIGKIKRAYLCTNRPAPNRLGGPRPAVGQQAPPELNWEQWIGTAPMRPFVPEIYHPARWRAWRDFSTSWVGDMGCHLMDATWRALGLKAPKSVIAEVDWVWKEEATWRALDAKSSQPMASEIEVLKESATERQKENWPLSDHVTWTFAGGPLVDGGEMVIEWFDGEFLPPEDVRAMDPSGKFPSEGTLVVGTEGALLQRTGGAPMLLPREKFQAHPKPDLPPRDHYEHFVDACLGKAKTESHFAQTGPMTEAILLASIAIRNPGQRLDWEAATMKIPNFPDAERFLRRGYRNGWAVSGAPF
ncbi:MAG TPA: Gfo/Idh/MocA family oxidoreductase [Verrucomicrobiae bacterium]|nr:Gfo/Idh/MocA family oxidoreductase [Verrucomicrobiae bacterium]